MLRKVVLLMVSVMATLTLYAQTEVKLWDNASAPHSNHLQGGAKDEGGVRYSNTTEAVLYIYRQLRILPTRLRLRGRVLSSAQVEAIGWLP